MQQLMPYDVIDRLVSSVAKPTTTQEAFPSRSLSVHAYYFNVNTAARCRRRCQRDVAC